MASPEAGCRVEIKFREGAACWDTALSPPSPPGSHLINNVCERREWTEEDTEGDGELIACVLRDWQKRWREGGEGKRDVLPCYDMSCWLPQPCVVSLSLSFKKILLPFSGLGWGRHAGNKNSQTQSMKLWDYEHRCGQSGNNKPCRSSVPDSRAQPLCSYWMVYSLRDWLSQPGMIDSGELHVAVIYQQPWVGRGNTSWNTKVCLLKMKKQEQSHPVGGGSTKPVNK